MAAIMSAVIEFYKKSDKSHTCWKKGSTDCQFVMDNLWHENKIYMHESIFNTVQDLAMTSSCCLPDYS
jgi:hypothetical protein